MKVIGITGSQRKNGNTAFLVQETLNSIDGAETELISLGDYEIKGCNGCEGCKKTYKCVIQDGMQEIYPKLLSADAIVVGSPTYFYNITSIMKAFIERLYCFQVFADDDRSVWSSINEALGGKYAVVISICEQNNEGDMGVTPEAMSKPLEGLGYRIIESVKILELFERGEAQESDIAVEKVRKAGEKLGKSLKLKQEMKERFDSIYK